MERLYRRSDPQYTCGRGPSQFAFTFLDQSELDHAGLYLRYRTQPVERVYPTNVLSNYNQKSKGGLYQAAFAFFVFVSDSND